MSKIPADRWSEAFRIFDTARDMTESDLARWLDQLNDERPDLVTTVRALLSAHARRRTNNFLDQGVVLHMAPDGDGWIDSESMKAGERIGPYRLVRSLGQGGMAAVWLAMGGEAALKRDVALKVPQGIAWRPGLSGRFARERDILARLEHPNIARLYDAGIAGSDSSAPGLPYLAMEYVDGLALTAYCDEHRLGIAARLELMLQVLDAVQYAHNRMVVHRDLKPANILVTKAGQVRLLDFGIAKLLIGDDEDQAPLTQLGAQAFTPDYASPEQMRGVPLGAASDIYSLGVILYELLCGQRPHQLRRSGSGAFDSAALEGAPVTPSLRLEAAAAERRGGPCARLSRELAGDLDTIVLKALKYSAEERYPTAAALSDDIHRFRLGQPVLARPDSYAYRARKYMARHRVVVGAAIAISLSLVLGLVTSIWQYERAAAQARVAQIERDRALRSAQRGEALNQFMSDLLIETAQAGQGVKVEDLLKKQAAQVELEFADDPSVLADLLIMLGELHGALDGPTTLLPYFDRAQSLLGDRGDPKQYVDLLCNSVRAKVQTGRMTAVAAVQAIAKAVDDPTTQADDAANCLYQKAALESEQGRPDLAVQTARQALGRLSPRSRDRRERSIVTGLLAASLAQSGRPGEADAQFKTALALMEALHRERSVSASVLRLNWAVTLIQAGVPRPALDLLDLDLDIERQDFPDAPLPARMVFSKAGAEIEMGRFAESIAGLRQALLLAGAAHDVVVMFGAHCAMATALANLGRTADAEREFGLARSMHGPALEAGPLARNTLRLTRAALDLIEGLYAQARTAADAVLSATAASKAHRAQALLSRAEAEVGMARGAEALSDADACVALSRALQGHLPASSRTGKGMLVRAQALQLLGRTSEARESAAGAVRELTSTVDGSYPALRAAIAFLPD